MFQKLKISLSDIDIAKLKGDRSLNHSTFKQYSIIDTEYLFDSLNKKVKFDVLPQQVNLTEITYPGVGPHTDSWQTAINFYFEAGNDETFFWKEIEPSPNLKKESMGPAIAYDPANLEMLCSFKADKGDCYLLDVGNSIHSVKMYTPTTRKILRLAWYDLSFNQVLENLKFL